MFNNCSLSSFQSFKTITVIVVLKEIFSFFSCFRDTSAGGTGVLLNIEKVSSQLELMGAEAQVRGLVDSGWFLESRQQKVLECSDGVSCSPVDAIKKGLR